MFIDFRERGRERERERRDRETERERQRERDRERDTERERQERQTEKEISVREKYWLVASHTCPDQGLKPQPKCVPWLGIEPTTFWCGDDAPTNWATWPGWWILTIICTHETIIPIKTMNIAITNKTFKVPLFKPNKDPYTVPKQPLICSMLQ